MIDYVFLAYGFIGGVVFLLLFQRYFTITRRKPDHLKFFLPNMNNGYIELPHDMLDRILPPMPVPRQNKGGEKPKDDSFGANSYL